jgi:hypothetical protein
MGRRAAFEVVTAMATLTFTACGDDEPPVSDLPDGTANVAIDGETLTLDVRTCDSEDDGDFSLLATSEEYSLEVTRIGRDDHPTDSVSFKPLGGFGWDSTDAELEIDSNGVTGYGIDLRGYGGPSVEAGQTTVEASIEASCP